MSFLTTIPLLLLCTLPFAATQSNETAPTSQGNDSIPVWEIVLAASAGVVALLVCAYAVYDYNHRRRRAKATAPDVERGKEAVRELPEGQLKAFPAHWSKPPRSVTAPRPTGAAVQGASVTWPYGYGKGPSAFVAWIKTNTQLDAPSDDVSLAAKSMGAVASVASSAKSAGATVVSMTKKMVGSGAEREAARTPPRSTPRTMPRTPSRKSQRRLRNGTLVRW